MSQTMTPREIVSELDRFIIGQDDAKRAVAIALRNRWRRQKVESPMREEITPKNILMIGPTGVGKTEIARRLARLAKAPFIKVEATKYTEVGYVGRDVESIVRDLVDFAIKMVRDEHLIKVQTRAEEAAEEHLLNILIPHSIDPSGPVSTDKKDPQHDSREKMRHKLRLGELDNRQVEIDMPEQAQMPMLQMFTNQGGEEIDMNLKDMLSGLGGGKKKNKRMTIKEAMHVLKQQELTACLIWIASRKRPSNAPKTAVSYSSMRWTRLLTAPVKTVMYPVKAYSVICCHWSKAPASTVAMDQ